MTKRSRDLDVLLRKRLPTISHTGLLKATMLIKELGKSPEGREQIRQDRERLRKK